MRIQDLTQITPELENYGSRQIDELIKEQVKVNAESGNQLYIWRSQKSCPKCLKMYSKKGDTFYCPDHPEETRLVETVENETRFFRYIQTSTIQRRCAGIADYKCNPENGDQLEMVKYWTLGQMEIPQDAARIVVAYAIELMKRANIDHSKIFTMVKMPNIDVPTPRLVDGADPAHVASALNSALDALQKGIYSFGGTVKQKLADSHTIIDMHLQLMD